MLYASNAKTYPQMLARARAYAQAKGVDLGDLPETFDDAQAWARGDVPVGSQIQLQDMRDYRDAIIGARNAATAARNQYYQGRLGQYAQTNDERRRHNMAQESNSAAGVAVRRDAVAKAPDRSKWTQPVGRGGGGSVAPGTARKFVWDAAKGKYVAQ